MLREAEGGWCLPVIAKVDCHKRLWDERIMLRFLIAALAVFAHAPESEAKSPKLAIRLIAALEKNVQKLPSWGYRFKKCVRIYTVETINGVSVGRGVIVAPGGGIGFPNGVKSPSINPKLLQPGRYIVRPEQMPIFTVSYFATDFGMYTIRFDLKTGTLLDDR